MEFFWKKEHGFFYVNIDRSFLEDSHFSEWWITVIQVTQEAAPQLVSLCTAKGSKLHLNSKILHQVRHCIHKPSQYRFTTTFSRRKWIYYDVKDKKNSFFMKEHPFSTEDFLPVFQATIQDHFGNKAMALQTITKVHKSPRDSNKVQFNIPFTIIQTANHLSQATSKWGKKKNTTQLAQTSWTELT